MQNSKLHCAQSVLVATEHHSIAQSTEQEGVVVQIIMFPSKSEGMFVAESLIFRSDSNGEDLEGYAGAGLYDSITMDPTNLKKVDYNGDRYAVTAGGWAIC